MKNKQIFSSLRKFGVVCIQPLHYRKLGQLVLRFSVVENKKIGRKGNCANLPVCSARWSRGLLIPLTENVSQEESRNFQKFPTCAIRLAVSALLHPIGVKNLIGQFFPSINGNTSRLLLSPHKQHSIPI